MYDRSCHHSDLRAKWSSIRCLQVSRDLSRFWNGWLKIELPAENYWRGTGEESVGLMNLHFFYKLFTMYTLLIGWLRLEQIRQEREWLMKLQNPIQYWFRAIASATMCAVLSTVVPLDRCLWPFEPPLLLLKLNIMLGQWLYWSCVNHSPDDWLAHPKCYLEQSY